LKAESIEDLLNRLTAIKAQKAEVERIEKETVLLLKERFKQQKDRIEKLGVTIEEKDSPREVIPPGVTPPSGS